MDNTRGRRDDREQGEAEAVFRVMLRPIASSLPMGFFAFMVGAYQVTGSVPVERAAGWLGIPIAFFALYGGLALLLEEGSQRMVLPLGRRGRARSSLEGTFAHQVHQAEQEAGVRRQL